MERTQLFDLMGELKLYGMKAAFDEIMTTAVKRQHEPQRIVGDLLSAEISEKHARSIKYQLTIAKLPLAKDLDDFQFDGTPINETLVNVLAGNLRRTVRTGLSRLRIAPHVAEAVLGHAAPRIQRTYDVYGLHDEKRHALEAWGRQLMQLVDGTPANVFALRG
jgi:hypothetical protein